MNLSRGGYRVQIEMKLTFHGPLHIGTGQRLATISDAPLLRDATGQVLLPGSSIRGSLRDWCEREAPLLGVGDDAVKRLFGDVPKRCEPNAEPTDAEANPLDDRQGRLTVRDAVVSFDVTTSREHASVGAVRDHVRIERKYEAAAKGGKFDAEVADAVTATVCLTYEGDSVDDPELRLIRSGLDALGSGLITLGAKGGWGHGVARVEGELRANTKQRSEIGQLSEYLTSRLTNPENADGGPGSLPSAKSDRGTLRDLDQLPWSWLRVVLELQFDGPMLVAGFSPLTTEVDKDRYADVDAQYFRDGADRIVLPGSSLRGVLSAQCGRIVKSRAQPWERLVDDLFGTVKRNEAQATASATDDRGQRGLLRVGEGRLEGAPRTVLLNHVAIDRLTGFAASQKLFDALALASPRFDVEIFVRWHPAVGEVANKHLAAVGLLLLSLRDLQDGCLWVGSRVTRGYGWLKDATCKGGVYSVVEHVGGNELVRHEPTPFLKLADVWDSIPGLDAAWRATRRPSTLGVQA